MLVYRLIVKNTSFIKNSLYNRGECCIICIISDIVHIVISIIMEKSLGMNEYNSRKDKLDILFMKIKIRIKRFLKTKFGSYLWQILSSVLILGITGGIGVFAAYAQTEGSSMSYAKTYFKYFMTHSWSLMYGATDLENSKYINEESFAEMMSSIVPARGSDKYEFVDRGSDGKYHLIDVVYQETGSDVKQTMTLRMKKQEEKSLMILDQWEVCLTDEIIKDCTITAPAGMKLIFDGISLEDCPYTDDEASGLRTYTLDEVLAGKHTLELSGSGTTSAYENFWWEGSRSGYVVQTAEIPLSNDIVTVCSDNAIDIIVGIYTGVLTNTGCDSVKEFFTTDEDKAGVDAVYANMSAEVNREDGSMLVSMSFDSYDTSIVDYVYGQSFGVKFTFGTTFSAKGSRSQLSGVRENYEGSAKGEAVVRFECHDGNWVPCRIEMGCFDYSKPAQAE